MFFAFREHPGIGRNFSAAGRLVQLLDLFCRDIAVEENAAGFLSVQRAHLGGISAFDQQRKAPWIGSAVIILNRHHPDWHLGNRQFLERLLIKFHHLRHVGGSGRHFMFVVCVEFQADQVGADDCRPNVPY